MKTLQHAAGQYLKDLADGVAPRRDHGGICTHLMGFLRKEFELTGLEAADMAAKLIQPNIGDWYLYSGDRSYPVPAPVELRDKPDAAARCFRAAHRMGTMWKGEYGEYRKQLARALGRRLMGEE